MSRLSLYRLSHMAPRTVCGSLGEWLVNGSIYKHGTMQEHMGQTLVFVPLQWLVRHVLSLASIFQLIGMKQCLRASSKLYLNIRHITEEAQLAYASICPF
jgi:hypothetical protein